MTTIPALLGDGGHGALHQAYTANVYSNVGLGRCPMITEGFTDESYVSQPIRVSGTISYLSWGLDSPFGGELGTTLTLTLNRNFSASGLAISIGPSTTGWVTDCEDSVHVDSGDWLDFAADVGSGNSSYSGNFFCASAQFNADTGSAQMLATVGAADFFPSSEPQYVNFLGVLDGQNPTETDAQFLCLADGTWQYLACYVESNSFHNDSDSATMTVTDRINGGTTTSHMAISISDSATGYFEDGTDSDTVCAGDYLDYELVNYPLASSGGSLLMVWIGAHFFATTTTQCMIGGTPDFGTTIAAGPAVYSSLFGGGNPFSDLSRSIGFVPYDLSASLFTNYITNADKGCTATFTLRNGSCELTTSSSMMKPTGYFTAVGTLSFAVGDTCANEVAVSGGEEGANSVTWAGAGVLLTASGT